MHRTLNYEGDPVMVYAKWINVHGDEVWLNQAMMARKPATVTIRYRDDVSEKTIITKNGEHFNVLSADNIQERNEYLECKVLLVKGSN